MDDLADELTRKSEQHGDRSLYLAAEQLRIIAGEITHLYDVHHYDSPSLVKCGRGTDQVDYTMNPAEVTCKRCLVHPWFYELDKEFVRRTGNNWHNLCGDWDLIEDWYDNREKESIPEIVTRWIEKYNLTDLTTQ